jgi:hypothetical protein
MKIGMLWFDNDQKHTLDQKIQGAATYYATKYGAQPNLCYVHPSLMPTVPEGTEYKAGGVEVRGTRSVMPNHLWIGVVETK